MTAQAQTETRLVVDEPQAGYYLAPSRAVPRARLKKDQLWVPASIWWTVPEDPDSYDELDVPPLKAFCEVDGREADAHALWPILASNPITREEYERRKAEQLERRSRPTEPIFDDNYEPEPNEDEMNIDSVFPSKYLGAPDLQGRDLTVTVDRIDMETIGTDRKPVMYFRGGRKGLVLNKTNSNCIKQLYGNETDDWTGQKLTLFTAWVEFQGKQVEAVRIRGVTPAGVAPRTPQSQQGRQAPPSAQSPDDDMSDIPF